MTPIDESEGNTLVQELENSFEQVYGESVKEIRIFCSYEKLRVPANETKFWAGTVEFSFHDNAYEINFQDVIPTKSILYNEFLSDEEMTNLVNIFSQNLMKLVNNATLK